MEREFGLSVVEFGRDGLVEVVLNQCGDVLQRQVHELEGRVRVSLAVYGLAVGLALTVGRMGCPAYLALPPG